MTRVEFTDNHEDLSTASGFQFKFYCESCGNGYMSDWKANKTGIAGSLLRGAGGILGGVLGSAAANSYEIQEAIGGPAHDKAMATAVAEIRPLFVQCKRCGNWVCREVCWNDERGLCATCAPVAQRELGAMQATIGVEQMQEKLRAQDLTEGINLTTTAVVVCPHCQADAGGGKFCQECGEALAARSECARCGTKMESKAKFCPECGQPRE
jgi:hypothetical protein